jgi:hypothetical protein
MLGGKPKDMKFESRFKAEEEENQVYKIGKFTGN